jgi:hypothetical protein
MKIFIKQLRIRLNLEPNYRVWPVKLGHLEMIEHLE